jgi:hypothetical protein
VFGTPISSFLRMAVVPTPRAGWPQGVIRTDSIPAQGEPGVNWSVERSRHSHGVNGGHRRCAVAVINVLGIFGTAFGLLVTIALLCGYVDELRTARRGLKDAEDSSMTR